MRAALNTAALGTYTLSDRETWLRFGNKGVLTVLVEGALRLLNRYNVIPFRFAKPNNGERG
jgi:tungstate transport system substrate-binding protein